MERSQKFIVEGEPIPLQRARRARNIFYDPQFRAKQNFSWIVKRALEPFEPISSPIKMKVEFHMPIPKSLSLKKRISLINHPHTKTKDIDNLCKFLFDALNKIVWEDDCLIWNVQAIKIYSETPKTVCELTYDV